MKTNTETANGGNEIQIGEFVIEHDEAHADAKGPRKPLTDANGHVWRADPITDEFKQVYGLSPVNDDAPAIGINVDGYVVEHEGMWDSAGSDSASTRVASAILQKAGIK